MATDKLQSTLRKWNEITGTLNGYGVPKEKWAPLAKQDLQAVMSGGQPMTDGQIKDALLASITGKPVVQHTNEGINSPLDLLGNIVSDVRSLPENFTTGIAQYASSFPQQVQDFIKLAERDPATQQKYGMETSGGPAAFLRDMARVPVFSPLIPGLHTLAASTSESGRKELEAHPGYALLDVAAGATELGKMGVLGGGAEAGSPLEALQKGQPFKAAGRGIMDTAAHLPGVPERTEVFHALNKLGWGSDLLNKVIKPAYVAQRAAESHVVNYARENFAALQEWAKANPEDAHNFFKVVNEGNPFDLERLPPEQQAFLPAIDHAISLHEQFAKSEGFMREIITPDGQREVYTANSDVGKADQAVQDAQLKVRELMAKSIAGGKGTVTKSLERASKRLADAKEQFQKALTKEPPQRYNAAIGTEVRSQVAESMAQKYNEALSSGGPAVDQLLHGRTLDSVMHEISTTSEEKNLEKWVGKEEYTAIKRDSVAMWLTMAKEGFNPRYITNVEPGLVDAVHFPKIVPGETHTPSHFLRHGFNLGNTQMNIAVALTKAESEVTQMLGERTYFHKYIKPLVKDRAQMESEYIEATRQHVPEHIGTTQAGIAKAQLEKDYVEIRVDNRGNPHSWRQILNPGNDPGILLPKEVANALDRMAGEKAFLGGAKIPGLNLFKTAVLVGPRHMAHIMLGGLVFVLGSEPGALRFIKDGWEISRDPSKMPALFQSLHDLHDDGLWHWSSGKTIGRVLSAIPDAMERVERHVADTYKASVMLSQEAKGATAEQAIAVANKVLVDMDNMTPFEKQVVRQVFPFYGFTKHILRYAFMYPVDHPLRMSFLANLSRQVQEGDTGALPGYFNTLFFLGKPDAAGNVNTVDFKNVNPFRSLYNEFTLGGMLSSLNPYVAGVMEASGLNVLSATPELYPDLQVDPQSGQLVARRNAPETGLKFSEAFVPEITSLDAMLGLSSRMKGLKQANPEAFHRALWTSLNMPFTPSSYNLNHETQRLEIRRFTQAQKDVSSALRSNDFSWLEGYNLVPVPAYLKPYLNNQDYVHPSELAALWATLVSQSPQGVNPKAVIPSSRSRTSPL